MTRILQTDLARDALYTKVNQIADEKQDVLEFDTTPTSNSDNPVTSSGIKLALDIKANDNEVVHLTGNENISGVKTFASEISIGSGEYKKSIYRQSNGNFAIAMSKQDNSGWMSYITMSIAGRITINAGDDTATDRTILLQANSVTAPTPTDTTTTSGTQIATTGWVNSTDNNVVHKTGYETITGYKTFKTQVEFDSPNMIQGTNRSGNGIEFYDKNLNIFGFLRPQATTNANILSLCATRVVNGQIYYARVDPTVDSSGNCYVKVPNSDVNGSVVTTVNKSKATNGYFQLGNGLIVQWGSSVAATGSGDLQTITFPKAFTSTNYYAHANLIRNSATNAGWGYITSKSASSCKFVAETNVDTFTWIAIGY